MLLIHENLQIFVDLGPPKAQSMINLYEILRCSWTIEGYFFENPFHFQISMQIAMQPFSHHSLWECLLHFEADIKVT